MVLLVFWNSLIFFSHLNLLVVLKICRDVLEGERCFLRVGVCIWGLWDLKFYSYSLHVDLLSANNRA